MGKQRRWTEEDLDRVRLGPRGDAETIQPKKGRYGNIKKIEEDGHRFDSKREYLRYKELKLLERAGEITDLRVHPRYEIVIGGVPIMVCSNQHNKWDRPLVYEADFEYLTAPPFGERVILDVKMQSGHRTGVYKLKRALMRAMGYEITEY